MVPIAFLESPERVCLTLTFYLGKAQAEAPVPPPPSASRNPSLGGSCVPLTSQEGALCFTCHLLIHSFTQLSAYPKKLHRDLGTQ